MLLKLITPYSPPEILIKSIVFFKSKCLGFGLDNGAKYSSLLTLNNTPINGLNSLVPALYGTHESYFLK